MPRGNGRGPEGLGTMTGRGLGYCAGYDGPGCFDNRRGGRGFGRGFARKGRKAAFRRRGAYAFNTSAYNPNIELTVNEEIDYLQEEAQLLQEQLENIQNQIAKLETEQED
ncbi:hypothetical protein BX659_12427 [Orenia metallireducens]|jgi:hypothetical protein|uniref:DUF5320 domain-containing protein n=1 Tax=Orenia metallireducens TaxID=1413210 RepID=A0A285G844_9FIRM|nr:DUF5320 domain-containing protein [Orenia metallireducens]PRX24203.1 hypothetical protein BX659_12427 [Orenia metallireducens]SNY19722.1 hypothetical protein SAMN06265827_105178 [Orenia metallireducens]